MTQRWRLQLRSLPRSAVVIAVVLVLAFMVVVFITIPAQAATEHCLEGGTKTESVVNGDLDGIVLPAGTLFCVKASIEASIVLTADGVKTLLDYVTWLNEQGQPPNVSYYVVYPSTTTSSTTTTGSTTTTTGLTTTTQATTTTSPNVTTTTAGVTTTTARVTTTTAGTATTTVGTVSGTLVPLQTLPFTGFDPALFVGVALGLGSTGAYLLRRGRR